MLISEEDPKLLFQLTDFVSAVFQYPQIAFDCRITGRARVIFYVTPNGRVIDVQCLDSYGFGIEDEASGILKLMDGFWTPGKANERPVKVKMTIPILFIIGSEYDKKPDYQKYKQFKVFSEKSMLAYEDSTFKWGVEQIIKPSNYSAKWLPELERRKTYLRDIYALYKKGLDGEIEKSIKELIAFEEGTNDGLALFLASNVYRFHGDNKKACRLLKRVSGRYVKLSEPLKEVICK